MWRAGNSRAANHRNIVRNRPSEADHSSDSVAVRGFGRIARLVGSVHDGASPPSSDSSVEPARVQNRLGSAPLPHLFPCLDQLPDRPRTREMPRSNPTDHVCAAVEILHCSDAHHREAALQLCQISSAENLVRRSRTASHDRENGITKRRTKGECIYLPGSGKSQSSYTFTFSEGGRCLSVTRQLRIAAELLVQQTLPLQENDIGMTLLLDLYGIIVRGDRIGRVS